MTFNILIVLLNLIGQKAWSESVQQTLDQQPAIERQVNVGAPLTDADRRTFSSSINACFNYDPGSVVGLVAVTVGFNLNLDGTVENHEVRLIDAAGGDAAAVETFFQAARRAVLRCEKTGYQLPSDKYEQWKEVVAVFDATGVQY